MKKRSRQDTYFQRYSDTISVNEENRPGNIQKKKIFDFMGKTIKVLDDPTVLDDCENEIFQEDARYKNNENYKSLVGY